MHTFNSYIQRIDEKSFLSQSAERENAKDSSIQKKYNYRGWDCWAVPHAQSQQVERNENFKLADWMKMFTRIHAVVSEIEDDKRTNAEMLFYSRSLMQAFVCNIDFRAKEIRVMTFLPIGKSRPMNARDGTPTPKYIVESVEYEVIVID